MLKYNDSTSKILYTLNKSKICRTPMGVGKKMGSKIYVHKNYADLIVPKHILNKAKSILGDDFKYNAIMYNISTPNIVRFDEVPGFDTEQEPTIGKMITIDVDNNIIKTSYTPQIWHHKWLWVKDDYKGFDVLESYNWSKKWLEKITSPSGYIDKWEAELKEKDLKGGN